MKKIPLTRGKVALVDDSDFSHLFSLGPWEALSPSNGIFYAVRRTRKSEGRGRKLVYMHAEIMGPVAPGMCVSHRGVTVPSEDRGLDNRRENLTVIPLTTIQQGQRKTRGTSRFKGVYWSVYDGQWRASVGRSPRKRDLGRFSDEREAALAYDAAALELFGERAMTNQMLGLL